MTQLPQCRLVARNIDPHADNAIHDDDVARRLGFAGALVPGVELVAYATRPAVLTWGREWLTSGALSLRFRRPVYDGEHVTVRACAGVLTLDVAGEARAVGRVEGPPTGPSPVRPAPDLGRFAWTALPVPPLPVSDAALPDGPLGSIEVVVDTATHLGYLEAVAEPGALYRDEGLVHPGVLLRLVNAVLMSNVVLGPWVHTASDVQMLGVAPVGASMTVHGWVTGRSERHGHHSVHYDALVLADSVPVMVVSQSAIHTLAGG